jgi:hypothetical protein
MYAFPGLVKMLLSTAASLGLEVEDEVEIENNSPSSSGLAAHQSQSYFLSCLYKTALRLEKHRISRLFAYPF